MDGVVSQAGSSEPRGGPVPRGRECASGTGNAHGGAVGPDGGALMPRGPPFDVPVTAGGYVWWYIDALSDDGQDGLTIIAFVGSVFSPYYALSRRMGTADPENHVALNVALYGRRGNYWAMTERGKASLVRSAQLLAIGPSRMTWDHDALRIQICERTVPVPGRIEGEVVVRPEMAAATPRALDRLGRHHWHPIAPVARVSVRLERPRVHWSGHAYVDSNVGCEPLGAAFRDWSWSRTVECGRTRVFYDVVERDGSTREMALLFAPRGTTRITAPPNSRIGHTRWRLPLDVRSEAGRSAIKLASWEDGPFYARSLVELQLDGERTMAVQERLSLDRFEKPWVQAMLPFRMPRWTF
jgi:carotenoid 1,2-hydratase